MNLVLSVTSKTRDSGPGSSEPLEYVLAPIGQALPHLRELVHGRVGSCDDVRQDDAGAEAGDQVLAQEVVLVQV